MDYDCVVSVRLTLNHYEPLADLYGILSGAYVPDNDFDAAYLSLRV